MVKKIIVFVFIIFILTGCTTYSYDVLKDNLDAYLLKANEKLNIRANNFTEYYSYYIPSDMSEGECLSQSIVFNYSNSRIIMNINIAGLIAKNHYSSYRLADDGIFDETKVIYDNLGTYTDADGNFVNYFIKIYEGSSFYLIHLMSDSLNFYAYSLKEEAYETAKHMMLIARGTSVKADDILANYSTIDVVNAERKQVDLFQYVIPKQGYLSELIVGSSSDEK